MANPFILLFLITTALLSFLWTKSFRQYALNKGLTDTPNHRSSHYHVTPRGGGVIFISTWILSDIIAVIFNWLPLSYAVTFMPGVAVIALVSFIDDNLNIPAKWRFLIQLAAAIFSVYMLGGLSHFDLGIYKSTFICLSTFILVIAIVWSTNLFNFMDGMDGIASCEAIFVYGVGGLMLYLSGGTTLALLSWILIASISGFLVLNWPTAKIFMGDTGSTVLGFLIIPFAIAGENWYQLPMMLWLLLYSLFIFDATVTLIRRVLAGEKWYQAHRMHAYQRLHQSGWSHQQVLLGCISINILIAGLTLIAFFYREFLPEMIVMVLGFLTFVYWLIERKKPMFTKI